MAENGAIPVDQVESIREFATCLDMDKYNEENGKDVKEYFDAAHYFFVQGNIEPVGAYFAAATARMCN